MLKEDGGKQLLVDRPIAGDEKELLDQRAIALLKQYETRPGRTRFVSGPRGQRAASAFSRLRWVRLFFVGGPRGFLRAARQELLDASKAWWGGWRVRLADRRCCPISVSLGVVALVLARFVEVPVRIEVAAGS